MPFPQRSNPATDHHIRGVPLKQRRLVFAENTRPCTPARKRSTLSVRLVAKALEAGIAQGPNNRRKEAQKLLLPAGISFSASALVNEPRCNRQDCKCPRQLGSKQYYAAIPLVFPLKADYGKRPMESFYPPLYRDIGGIMALTTEARTSSNFFHAIRWRKATQAGFIVGLILFLLNRGIPWVGSGAINPAIMGREIDPGHEATPMFFLGVLCLHMVVSIIYAWIISAIVHGFRPMIAGIIGGVVGLVLYFISAAVSGILSELPAGQHEWPSLVLHIAFGIIVAETYKGLAKRRPAPIL